MQAKPGAENTEDREDDVAEKFMRQAHGDLHQGYEQARFAHQPGYYQKDAHLLEQQQHQIEFVHTLKPHYLKARNIHR